ncbi:hypothetical protein DFH09DRAFT_1152451 [Mycena vulgaris]|nr:hypothetical protein DFH09DRAFT_1152451 [Mycena vulgaris]
MDSSHAMAYGPTLPPEIWGRCWSYSSPRDLRRLVFPLQFQNQSFTAPDFYEIDRESWIQTTRGLHRSTLRLSKLAASAHVSSVRSWNFEGTFDYAELPNKFPNVLNVNLVEETYLKMVGIFTDTLGGYQNLRSLRLASLTIDAPFRETLALVPRLKDLDINTCHITGRMGAPLSLQTFTLRRSLFSGRQTQDHCDDPFEIVSPRPLRVLKLDGCRDSLAFLAVLANETSPFINLVTLSVELSDAAAKPFLAFLERCPQLTSLDLSKSTLSHPNLIPLPPTAIPRLQSFTGPRGLAAMFISDRPVSAVTLPETLRRSVEDKALGTDILSEVADLAHSSTAVHSLSMAAPIEIAPELLAVIATQLPDLRELDLLLKEPPPVRSPGDNPGLWNYSDSEGSESEEDVDERTVELSDDGSLESVRSFGYFSMSFSDDEDERPAPIPDVLLPGHMYRTSGEVSPPAPAQAAAIDTAPAPTSLPRLLDQICAGGAALPAPLISLRFGKPWVWNTQRITPLTLADEHRVVLALEKQQPALRELEFAVYDTAWTRHGDVWLKKGGRTKVMSNVRRGE